MKTKKENYYAELITLSLLAVAITLFVISTGMSGYIWIPQLISLGFIVAALMLATRYLLCRHSVSLYDGSLVVIKEASNRRETEANLLLAPGTRLFRAQGSALPEPMRAATKIFNYCNVLYPKTAYYLLTDFNGNLTAVKIECDAKLLEDFAMTGITAE